MAASGLARPGERRALRRSAPWLLPVAVAAALGLGVAHLAPNAEARVQATGSAGISVKPLASGWVGLPTRVLVSVPGTGWAVSAQVPFGSRWRTVSTVEADQRGSALLSWVPSNSGRGIYRVVARSTTGARTLYSGPKWIYVRTATGQPGIPPSPTTATVEQVVRAGGQSQWVSCAGAGGPTVVLVSGVTGWSRDWARQVPPLRENGRVCVYDRAGLGSSPARTGPTGIDSLTHATELRALLSAAGERGPYILVGHSYGGLVVRSFANAWPELVVGLGLLEAVPPDMADHYDGYARSFGEAGASIDLDASARTTGYLRPLNGLPLLVLSAGHPVAWAPSWVARVWDEQQDLTASGSANSLRLTAVASGHQLQEDVPDVVSDAISMLRDSVRRHAPLPACPAGWSPEVVRCTTPG